MKQIIKTANNDKKRRRRRRKNKKLERNQIRYTCISNSDYKRIVNVIVLLIIGSNKFVVCTLAPSKGLVVIIIAIIIIILGAIAIIGLGVLISTVVIAITIFILIIITTVCRSRIRV